MTRNIMRCLLLWLLTTAVSSLLWRESLRRSIDAAKSTRHNHYGPLIRNKQLPDIQESTTFRQFRIKDSRVDEGDSRRFSSQWTRRKLPGSEKSNFLMVRANKDISRRRALKLPKNHYLSLKNSVSSNHFSDLNLKDIFKSKEFRREKSDFYMTREQWFSPSSCNASEMKFLQVDEKNNNNRRVFGNRRELKSFSRQRIEREKHFSPYDISVMRNRNLKAVRRLFNSRAKDDESRFSSQAARGMRRSLESRNRFHNAADRGARMYQEYDQNWKASRTNRNIIHLERTSFQQLLYHPVFDTSNGRRQKKSAFTQVRLPMNRVKTVNELSRRTEEPISTRGSLRRQRTNRHFEDVRRDIILSKSTSNQLSRSVTRQCKNKDPSTIRIYGKNSFLEQSRRTSWQQRIQISKTVSVIGFRMLEHDGGYETREIRKRISTHNHRIPVNKVRCEEEKVSREVNRRVNERILERRINFKGAQRTQLRNAAISAKSLSRQISIVNVGREPKNMRFEQRIRDVHMKRNTLISARGRNPNSQRNHELGMNNISSKNSILFKQCETSRRNDVPILEIAHYYQQTRNSRSRTILNTNQKLFNSFSRNRLGLKEGGSDNLGTSRQMVDTVVKQKETFKGAENKIQLPEYFTFRRALPLLLNVVLGLGVICTESKTFPGEWRRISIF